MLKAFDSLLAYCYHCHHCHWYRYQTLRRQGGMEKTAELYSSCTLTFSRGDREGDYVSQSTFSMDRHEHKLWHSPIHHSLVFKATENVNGGAKSPFFARLLNAGVWMNISERLQRIWLKHFALTSIKSEQCNKTCPQESDIAWNTKRVVFLFSARKSKSLRNGRY